MGLSEYLKCVRGKVGHDYLLLPGVSALVFNDRGELLLGRRSDNGRWSVIGGVVDPDEEPAVAVVREVMEETGVAVVVERVSGVYVSSRITYPNDDVAQYVIIAFRCVAVSGEPRVNDEESLEVRYFPMDDLPADLSADARRRIADAAAPGAGLPAVFASRRD